MSILLETMTVGDVPTLVMSPSAAHRCPAVFYISGYGSSKEAGLSIGYRLARRGCFFISFDAWLHGERYDPRLDHAADPELGGIYPPETGLDTLVAFYQVIHRCLLDVQALMAHFAADPRVNLARCGVTGVSMGAYASFLVFARIPQVAAAVPMMGLPTFCRRWTDILDECRFSNERWASALGQLTAQTRAHTAFVEQIDPYERLKAAAPRALLIMNGDFDTDQPKLYSVDAYRGLLTCYRGHADRLKLSIYPVGHTVTPDMEQDAVAWLCQHLMEDL